MKKLSLALLTLSLLCGATFTRADDAAFVDAARKTAKAYEQAIVNISVIAKVTGHSTLPIGLGGGQEQKTESIGTVIDFSGMVVTSLSAVDQVRLMPTMKINIPEAGEATITFSSELHDLKYRLADGTEIPARIVLKDEDLDLAYIVPEKPLDGDTKAKIVALPLTDPAPNAQVVDRTILLGRTGKGLNYTPTLNLGRITACIIKPRRCYLGGAELGAPVFNAQGLLLGLFVNKLDHEVKTINPMAGGMPKPNMEPIILPIAEVSAGAKQATEEAAKPVEKSVPASEPATTLPAKSGE